MNKCEAITHPECAKYLESFNNIQATQNTSEENFSILGSTVGTTDLYKRRYRLTCRGVMLWCYRHVKFLGFRSKKKKAIDTKKIILRMCALKALNPKIAYGKSHRLLRLQGEQKSMQHREQIYCMYAYDPFLRNGRRTLSATCRRHASSGAFQGSLAGARFRK